MAVYLCSELRDASPRISFSHDFAVSGIIPVEQTPFRSSSPGSNPSFDFDSCSFDQGSSSADELFSDGKMIPLLEIKKRTDGSVGHSHLPTKKEEEEEQKGTGTNGCSNSSNKSFWGFKRSSSLNSGGGYGRVGLCPLPLLSRSNSTGSATTPRANKHSPPKPFHNQALPPNSNHGYQKRPLRKLGNGVGRNNAVRVDPVLNVASGNLFTLCSVFGRDKKKTK